MNKVIINLDTIQEVTTIEEAQELHNNYRDNRNLRSSTMFNSVVLDENNQEIGYISYNGRYWDWDNKDNPFVNGSFHDDMYKILKQRMNQTNLSL